MGIYSEYKQLCHQVPQWELGHHQLLEDLKTPNMTKDEKSQRVLNVPHCVDNAGYYISFNLSYSA